MEPPNPAHVAIPVHVAFFSTPHPSSSTMSTEEYPVKNPLGRLSRIATAASARVDRSVNARMSRRITVTAESASAGDCGEALPAIHGNNLSPRCSRRKSGSSMTAATAHAMTAKPIRRSVAATIDPIPAPPSALPMYELPYMNPFTRPRSSSRNKSTASASTDTS